jgi:YD repeat-containing protein
MTYSSGLLSTVQQPDSGVATFNYTSGLLSSVAQPGGFFLTYNYDAFNNLIGYQDAAANLYTLTYDGSNRLIKQQVGPLNVTYSYSGINGMLNEINRGLGTTLTITALAAQGLGAGNAISSSQSVAALTDALGNTTSYALDGLARLTGLQTADGATQSWIRDSAGYPLNYIDQLSFEPINPRSGCRCIWLERLHVFNIDRRNLKHESLHLRWLGHA